MPNMRVPPPEEAASLIGSKVDDYRWHSTERNLGSIQGIRNNMVLIATDGNLGCFVDSSGKLFLGHIQMFSERVRVKSLSR